VTRACTLFRTVADSLVALVMVLAMLASAVAARAAVVGDGLRPGEFVWSPELAPRGPVAIIVSLPGQRAYVYRNGVRIGTSTVSTGKPGHDTPGGIYSILEKKREHYSNLYDAAPMPFMQRLTWDGVALHAGGLPGYPASHGCVRLPQAFAERLFAVTGLGTVVVVADAATFPASVVTPGLFSPIDSATGSVRAEAPTPSAGDWFPERSPEGPLTVLLSTADRDIVVLRNGIEIGRAAVAVEDGAAAIGSHAYLLLEGTRSEPSPVLPDRPALRWQSLPMPGTAGVSDGELRSAFESRRIVVPGWFAQAVRAALQPGATLVLTDEPLQPRLDEIDRDVDLLTTDAADPG
jgi:hypothetical protein